jgi:hypothetical protein
VKFFVYIDSTTELSSRPFYVGKGNANRLQDFSRNVVHTRIKAKYGIQRRVIFETFDEGLALYVESETISLLNTFVPDGWGANLTLGGEGVSGFKPSEDSRKKNSESNKIAQAGARNSMFGRSHSEETRRKIGEKGRGRKHSSEVYLRIGRLTSERQTGKSFSQERKANISAATKGRTAWNKGSKRPFVEPSSQMCRDCCEDKPYSEFLSGKTRRRVCKPCRYARRRRISSF